MLKTNLFGEVCKFKAGEVLYSNWAGIAYSMLIICVSTLHQKHHFMIIIFNGLVAVNDNDKHYHCIDSDNSAHLSCFGQ